MPLSKADKVPLNQSRDASTASGKSTLASPLEEALKKVKAQLFKRDLMLTLEGEHTAPSFLKNTLKLSTFLLPLLI